MSLFSPWLIIALAAFLRLWNLGYPKKLVFDETYYVKDAWTLWTTGAEKSWPDNANPAFESGYVNTFLNDPSFVVHPPLGKWIMGLGMWLFGPANSYSWRISVALLSIAAVGLIMLVARILFQTQIWSLAAGFLFAIDGHAIVLGRTGLLDSILMFFALLAFYFLLRHLQSRKLQQPTWRQPWLLAAGMSLGAATAVKWSGVYFLAAFGLYVVFSDVLERRRRAHLANNEPEAIEVRVSTWLFPSAIQGLISFVLMVPIAIATYLASWTGWLVTSGGYDRDSNPNPFIALWNYHQDAYNFHINLHTPHSYASSPLTWLFDIRPTSFFYESLSNGQSGCASTDGCSSAITALGNPFIWLPAAASIFLLAYLFVTRRSRVGGLILLGIAGGYLPWLAFLNRTVFQFYSIAFLPWMILALVYVLRLYLHTRQPDELSGAVKLIGGYFGLAFAVSLFFLPIWIGTWTPYWYWHLHMWLPSWI
ncbi:MAG: dolichyl-phosphate-mannose--protein mannosyltransferase [Rhodoluna sp.]